MTQRVRKDLYEISNWIGQHSPQGALSWIDAFDKAKQKLSLNPNRYSLAPEAESAGLEVHHILFRTRRGRNYRALFLIENNKVLITHIRGPGQDFVSQLDFVER